MPYFPLIISIDHLNRLSPNEEIDIVTVSSLPEFNSSEVCCDVVLQWKELHGGIGAGGDNTDGGCWIERIRSCGVVQLTAADVVSGQLGVVLESTGSKSGEKLFSQTDWYLGYCDSA